MNTRGALSGYGYILQITLVATIACSTVDAAVTLLGTQYQQDNPYSEYRCVYHYGNYPTNCGTELVGSNAFVFVKNTGSSSVTINDVTFAGYSLNTILKRNVDQHDSASIWYYWDNPPADIIAAGEPVWYRADPNPIPAGGTARIAVRLRWIPSTSPLSVSIVTSAGTVGTAVTKDASAPQLANVGFSQDRTKVYLHWRRAGGAAPTSILMDGVDVTASATTVGDSSVNYAVSVLTFGTALANMSYHTYQGVYSDGKTATGALRTWVNPYLYGTWGAHLIADNDAAGAMAWIDSCEDRGVNSLIMTNGSGGLADFLATSAGKNYAEDHGYGYVKDSSAWGTNPQMWFIHDEPDIREGNVTCGTGLRIPCGGAYNQGVLGMTMLETGEELRAINPSKPTTINIDGNFKPDGWYAYGQLTDVMMIDSYYEQEQAGNHWYHPERDVLYTKPTSIYAAALAAATAAEPNPMHIILYSCEYKDLNLGLIWPFPTPASKRVQAYYSLAAGAKGMAYWWYKPGYPFNGLDANTTAAQALWKEMGLIGNEIKTLAPQLVTSHPVATALAPGTNVWAKALACGTDTIILIAVNDTIYMNTSGGCQYTNVNNATVTCTLPSWMQSPTLSAFEVAAAGVSDIGLQTTGNQTQVNLGTLKVTKMVVLTTNPQIWTTVAQRYDQLVRPGVGTIAPELLTPVAPAIVQHPTNRTPVPGGTAGFSVAASGSWPRTYQWQKNQVNLSDGGHYSGCATPTLVITGCSSGDAADYRCVVTNSAGNATSNAATLTLGDPVGPTITQHPSNRNVVAGETVTFTVAATGTDPLAYQWQKNQLNVTNGGHFSGAATPTLTIANADSSDAASYRCVVTNAYGTANSDAAALTVCTGPPLVNGDFEGGNTSGVATGWTGYQRATNPSTVWTIQTASPPAGGGLQYQQIANTSATGGGGVRQDIAGCVSGTTYTISGWMRTNSASATCTVKCSPTASTNWATAANLTPAQTTTSSTWVPFSGTVVATGTSMTIWLDGQTGGTGLNKASCFDSITVGGCGAPVAAPTITQHPSAQSVCAAGTANFTVAATGSGTLSYQWQKNSVNVTNGGHYSGCTTTTLAVSSADSGDVAGYRCVVTNSSGSTNSNAANLTLKSATAISQHPQAQSVAANATATFTVTAAGDGTLAYQWQKNSVNVTNGGHYSGCTTATLAIAGADSNDAANYRCLVTGGCGSATSNQAALTVAAAVVPGDFDADGDIDLDDFAVLQDCLTGTNVPVTDPACLKADLTSDGFVNQGDVSRFVGCMSGAAIPANPNCVN